MNILKHLIIQIESTEDVTNAYVESMQKTDPREMIWRESEFIHNLGKGYFMA